MRFIAITILSLLLLPDRSMAGDKPPAENEYVKFNIALKEKRLSPGSKGHLLISLKPKKGVQIPINPPMDVKLESSNAIISVGKLEIPKSKKKPYVESALPVKLSFTFSKTVQPGVVPIKGVLTYYYCSDAEGWCSKFKQPIELMINVVQP